MAHKEQRYEKITEGGNNWWIPSTFIHIAGEVGLFNTQDLPKDSLVVTMFASISLLSFMMILVSIILNVRDRYTYWRKVK